MLLVDFGENGGIDSSNGGFVKFLIGNLGSDVLGELGASWEGQDVRVVTEEEHLLLG